MAALPILFRGENRLIKRLLRLADGATPLPVANLSGARVQLIQRGTVKATAVLGSDATLRAGAADELVYELTSAVSAALAIDQTLVLRWMIKVPDAAFTVEPGHFIDILEEEPYLVK